MNKGDIITLTIEDMSVEGQGIGRAGEDPAGGGMVLFVNGAVKGDIVRAEVTKVKRNFAFAEVVETLETSPLRSKEFDCPHSAEGCGGCPLGELSYEAQLEIKESQVRNRLKRIAGIEEPTVRSIIGMDESDNDDQGCWRYRNKAAFPVSTGGIITRKGGVVEALGEPAVGFYRARSHEVIDCGDCYLQSMAAVAAADALRRFMIEDNITGYDPKWDRGLMKQMVVKTAFGTGEVMVVLGINAKGIPGAQKLIGMLDEAVAEVGYSLESVVLNNGDASGSGKNGDGYVTIAGRPVIREEIGDLEFEISPASFFQVNPVQMKRLYGKVREYCGLVGNRSDVGGKPVILDLYCGVGSIGLFCADMAEMVVGVESVKEAISDANRNSIINHIVNTRYVCGRAEEIIPRAVSGEKTEAAEWIGQAEIAILDPPRAGCRKELLDAIAFAEIPRIVYVSCDPATLARDIKLLTEHGYAFIEATPVDMFPHSGHVEVAAKIQKL